MKRKNHIYRINSDDGPTSVFILGDTKKCTIRQRFQQFKYSRKKKRVEKTITGEGHHSMEEVLTFAVNECGLTELDRDCADVREEYRQLRAAFIVQYQPELLGEYAKLPMLDSEEPDAVMACLEKRKEQLQRAMAVPEELFTIDMHKYVKEYPDINEALNVVIETKYGYIGGGAGGDLAVKDLNKIMIRLRTYYGVTQEDIDKRTERYRDLLSILCR